MEGGAEAAVWAADLLCGVKDRKRISLQPFPQLSSILDRLYSPKAAPEGTRPTEWTE